MSIQRTVIVITIITIISKILGFLREMILAYFFGTSFISDAYLLAISIPIILFGFLSCFSIAYIPIYTDIRYKNGDIESNKFTNKIISITIILSIFCVLICNLFNAQVVNILAPGFSLKTSKLTSEFLYISVNIILIVPVANILVSYLNCNNKYFQSNIATLSISIIQIVFLFVGGIYNFKIIIWGMLCSHIIYIMILYLFVYKNGFKFRFCIRITDDIKVTLKIILPIFFTNMLVQINSFIDKVFASQLVEGCISSLKYAEVLRNFIFYVATYGLTTIVYPIISKMVTQGDIEKVKNVLIKSIDIIIFIFVPCTLGAIILSNSVIIFIFQQGSFDNLSTSMTSLAFSMYCVGLLAMSIRNILVKVFYAIKYTKYTLYVGFVTVILNIMLDIILINKMSHAGLALATSISAIISIPIFFIILVRKIGSIYLKGSIILMFKAVISTLFMGIVVLFIHKNLLILLGSSKLMLSVILFVCIIIGAGIYFILMRFMNVKETYIILKVVNKLIKKI